MNFRFSSWAMGALVVAAVVLMPGRSSAVFFAVGPSSDEWGLKYQLEVSPASGDEMNVAFTLADPGRLKPIYSFTVVAFSKLNPDGGRSYLVKKPIELKMTKDGKLAGQVQIPKEYADIAMIRVLTLNVDGKRQTAGAAYYDIPLKKFLTTAPVADSSQRGPRLLRRRQRKSSNNITFAVTEARYVRVVCIHRGTEWGGLIKRAESGQHRDPAVPQIGCAGPSSGILQTAFRHPEFTRGVRNFK